MERLKAKDSGLNPVRACSMRYPQWQHSARCAAVRPGLMALSTPSTEGHVQCDMGTGTAAQCPAVPHTWQFSDRILELFKELALMT